MFPRVVRSKKKNKIYEYLVISESVRDSYGKSTTKNIANLGSVKNFSKDKITSLIKGLARIFEIENLTDSNEIRVQESLEHGSILLWRRIWNQLGLSSILSQHIHQRENRIKFDVAKYVEMMVVNRCISPLSKLALSRWKDITTYKVMSDYSGLKNEVEYYYRSMDYLLPSKNEIEFDIFNRLRDLFSINVRLTFYDITSTYFYSGSCPISAHGHSRDSRSDLEQIVIGVVTSFEGYPIKHYVFNGSTKDETTVAEVVTDLKSKYNIQETVFVGDRGMITKLNIDEILDKDFDYIMGVKHKQEEKAKIFFADNALFQKGFSEYDGLKIHDKNLGTKEFIVWKISYVLQSQKIVPDQKILNQLNSRISELKNIDTKLSYKDFKLIITKLFNSEDKKIYYKIFKIIKKYEGKYETSTRFIICLNECRKKTSKKKRGIKLLKLEAELQKLFPKVQNNTKIDTDKGVSKIFSGYNMQYRKFFSFSESDTNKIIGYETNVTEREYEERFDGIFIITSNRYDLTAVDIIKPL